MSTEWKHASWVSTLGKWAWILVILNGVIGIIWGLYIIIPLAGIPFGLGVPFMGSGIWLLIGGILTALISFAIIFPKFSSKCAAKDWDSLFNWSLNLGGTKIPWMLIWGIIIEIFSWYYWGGLPVIIPALVLIFAGPKPYEWKTEK